MKKFIELTQNIYGHDSFPTTNISIDINKIISIEEVEENSNPDNNINKTRLVIENSNSINVIESYNKVIELLERNGNIQICKNK